MPAFEASMANDKKAMEVVKEWKRKKAAALKEAAAAVQVEDGTTDPMPTTMVKTLTKSPFLAAAEMEAVDDALVGVQRDNAWIAKRAKEIYEERSNANIAAPMDKQFFPMGELISAFKMAYKGEIGEKYEKEAKELLEDMGQENDEKTALAIEIDRMTRPVEATVQERIDQGIKGIKEKLESDHWEVRKQDAQRSFKLMWSMLLVGLIPIFGMLPGAWKSLQIIPLLIIVWTNWKPLVQLSREMKKIKENDDKIKPSVKADT
jgi:hypothetical protein